MKESVEDAGDSSGTPDGSSKTESTIESSDGDCRRFRDVSKPHRLLSGVANKLRPDGVAGDTISTFTYFLLGDVFGLRNSSVFLPEEILSNP
jgi:hypothetical protein